MNNKIINFDKIKLQPDYLTKYGKQYHELYNPYLKCKNKPFKLTEIRSFWESNPDEEETYYNDYEEVEYLSEEEYYYDKEDIEEENYNSLSETSESEEDLE